MTPAAQARLRLAASIAAATFLLCAGIALYRPGSGEREWVEIQREYLAARGSSAEPRVRERSVTWACAPAAEGECSPQPVVERCTTCHLGADEDLNGVDPNRLPAAGRPHPDRAKWLGTHHAATFGCTACHGGDGVSLGREAAHRGLARLGRSPGEVPEIEARCAACHAGPLGPTVASPAREAWARFRATVHRPTPLASTAPAAASDPAPALSEGRSLFRSLRCGACHASTEPVAAATPLGTLAVRSSQLQLAAGLRAHAEIAHVPLPDDEASVSSLAAHLTEAAQQDVATAVLHRATLTGSSGDEGRVLFERLACEACHDAPAQPPWLARLKATRTADWVAYYLADPARANPAARMPNMRITPREAASLATYLVEGGRETSAHGIDRSPTSCPLPDGPKPMPRAACGQALATAMQCSSCHAPTPEHVLAASSLLAYGDTHDGPAALAGLEVHGAKATRGALRFSLSDGERRALATFLVSQRTSHVLANFVPHGELWESARGAELYAELRCGGCHSDDPKHEAPGPSLFGEGLRTRPQWLFDFLRDPAHHAVLPVYHPEWAYRDLIPPDRASSRMPSYPLSDGDMTALVHFFTARDGASYPYATTTTPSLSGDELTSAIGELSHEDRGACLTCHTVALPDVGRARAEGDKLAAPLSLAHERLRPEWIEACILQPDVWVGPKMPVLFRDPFGPPLQWPAASDPATNALGQIDRLRDLVLMLRERTVLPPAGAEGHSPALGLGEL